jgi:GDPmannose 4,6-dehydratase
MPVTQFELLEASAEGRISCGEYFNIAGEEAFQLPEVIDILIGFSNRGDIKVVTDQERLRPIDADYQMFDNTKIRAAIDWKPEIPARKMFKDLLDHWRSEIAKGRIPLNR